MMANTSNEKTQDMEIKKAIYKLKNYNIFLENESADAIDMLRTAIGKDFDNTNKKLQSILFISLQDSLTAERNEEGYIPEATQIELERKYQTEKNNTIHTLIHYCKLTREIITYCRDAVDDTMQLEVANYIIDVFVRDIEYRKDVCDCKRNHDEDELTLL